MRFSSRTGCRLGRAMNTGKDDPVPGPVALPPHLGGSPGHRAVSIAAGLYQSAVVTESGSLFLFGERIKGRQNMQEKAIIEEQRKCAPREVQVPAHLVKVAVGGGHVVAIDREGGAWAMGSNESGQVGLGRRIDYQCDNMTKISLPEDSKATLPACGAYQIPVTIFFLNFFSSFPNFSLNT